MNNKGNVNPLQNSLLYMPHTYSIEFFTGWSTSKIPLLIYSEAALLYISISNMSSNLSLKKNFLLRKQEKALKSRMSMEDIIK